MNVLMNFRKRISELCEILESKPGKFVDKFVSLYGDEDRSRILNKMCVYLQETTLVKGEKITEAIGGSAEQFNEVRKQFVRVLDFKNVGILKSLRRLFWCFHMHGETLVVERILGDFAEVYVEMNPQTELKNSDIVFPFVFSILFLNTDLHKPQMVNKMTQEEFFRSV